MKARFWSFLSVLLFVAAIFFWLLGNERQQRANPSSRTNQLAPPVRPAPPRVGLLTRLTPQLAAASRPAPGAPAVAAASAPPAASDPVPGGPLRLRNTTKPLAELTRSDSAILLRNAFLDTAEPLALPLPAHLRADGDPGSYIIQARGPVDDAFRAALEAHGATVVSYIPNNAYLVRVDAAGAGRLANHGRTRAVLPYEPYCRLEPALLALAVAEQPLPPGAWLNVTLFPGEEAQARAEFGGLGVEIKGQSRTPFGPALVVEPPATALVTLAKSPRVQLLETYHGRALMNDLTRARLGAAIDTVVTNNYLRLTGSNIWVNVNDSGVDATHPDLKDRVFGDSPIALTDTNGHGTHTAGTIASTGQRGPQGTNAPRGSFTNANFRGLAPAAKLFVLPIDVTFGPLISDTYLQATAARTNYLVLGRTNAPLISNNSWGYPGQFDYDIAAASYDAAVRDALPDEPGMQPLVYVFAAGNSGAGNGLGQAGEPGTIASPATAKNVITVGATDSLRFITNEVITVVDGQAQTNKVFLGQTDSSDEVAPFSSRGNVGIGIEGTAGRFKPDLVAPGSFVVSTRAKGWDIQLNPTNGQLTIYPNQTVLAGERNNYSVSVPANATALIIAAVPNPRSPQPFPGLPIYVRAGQIPSTADYRGTNQVVIAAPPEGTWYYSIGNDTASAVSFDLRVTLQIELKFGDYFQVLKTLNDPLKPYYRYESGTSVSAAAVSGLLALLEEWFAQRQLPVTPALLKALLINGARSLGTTYHLQVLNRINYQGWGIPNLATILPPGFSNVTDLARWPVQWTNQVGANALGTGQAHTYSLSIPDAATLSDLRITLVWTDPPGNPAAAVKLVNDLDLVVSNQVTRQVYVGNDIVGASDYNRAGATNLPPSFDNINNVENVFLRHPLGTNYTVQVLGRRVNVNAVTSHPDNIAQDYALVVSLSPTNRFTFAQSPGFTNLNVSSLTSVSNGLPLLHERVGANSPLLGGAAGQSNQWHFYVFTNTPKTSVEGITNGQYIAFITFMPPDLSFAPNRMSEPRRADADVDLYVTRGDARLLTLHPLALLGAFKSVKRGGTELVTFSDSFIDEVFYIGIKAEDQNAGEYGFIGLSSNSPFEETDPFGNKILRGLPARVVIPDGSPVAPGAALMFAVGVSSYRIASVTAADTIVHNEPGDLLGNLSHANRFVVLNNHTLNGRLVNGGYPVVYDDSRSGENRQSLRSDGPGSLRSFVGEEGSGPWILTMVDNSLGHTGLVQNLVIRVEPNPDLEKGVNGVVLANQFKDYFFDVPPDASKMTVSLSSMTGPLNLYVRRGTPPTVATYDKAAFLSPPGGSLSIGVGDVPPLQAGRYFIGVFNPTAVTVSYFLRVQLERNLSAAFRRDFTSTNLVAIGDDTLTLATNGVNDTRFITDVKVGLRVDHPRVSDLAFNLVSPQGTRLLLDEARGGTNLAQLGFQTITTNYHHVALTYSTNSGRAALFLDGVLQIERDFGALRLQTTNQLLLGRIPQTNGLSPQYFGLLDEVDLYNRGLSASEILAIYKFGGAGKPTNGLVSRWSFDGNGLDRQTNNPAQIFGATFVPGKFGQALRFGGVGDVVTITNRARLDVGAGAGFTLDAWINPRDIYEKRPLAAWSDGTNAVGLEWSLLPLPGETNLNPGVLAANLVDLAGVSHSFMAPQVGLIQTNAVQTNLVYTTLTEDTNRALVPIKFAIPTGGAGIVFTNQLISGFETRTNLAAPVALDYLRGTNVDGWLVLTNVVSVLTAPPLVHTGTNLLALRDGWLRRTLPTVAGHTYRLQMTHRQQISPPDMISWWAGERNALDRLGANNGAVVGDVPYVPGIVGYGFLFATNAGFVVVPPNASLSLTNEVTLELWFAMNRFRPFGGGVLAKRMDLTPFHANYGVEISRKGLDFWFNDPTVQTPLTDDPGSVYELARLSPPPFVFAYRHAAMTLRQASTNLVEMSIYLDGKVRRAKALPGSLTNAVNNAPLLLGTSLAGTNGFNGILDEISLYERVLTTAEIEEIYLMNRLGKGPRQAPQTRLVVDGLLTNVFTSDVAWATNAVSFVASTNGTSVLLQPVLPGALLDSVELLELAATDFLPEESLKPFLGEPGAGAWKLEVTDRRTGATNPIAPELISWQLELTFAPPLVPAVRLTNALPYTNSIPGGEARYFFVEVPRSATRATNSLTAAPGLDLLFNQDGLPTGDPLLGDYTLLTNATRGIAVLATNGTWQAQTNGTPLSPPWSAPKLEPGQRYYLALTNLQTRSDYVIEVDFDALDTNVFGLTTLARGQTILTNIAVTNALQYYRYTISNDLAYSASFELYPTNGDVNLYIRKALPIPDPLPTPTVFDFASENPGTNAETILVTQDSIPPLGIGDWYLGVLNVSTNAVDYRIRVVESTNIPAQFIILTNGVPVAETVNPGPRLYKYFVFSLSNAPPAAQFDLFDLTGQADLLVQLNRKPLPSDYFQLDPGSPAAPAKIILRTNAALPSLNGDWYLGVLDREPQAVAFSIMASLPPPPPIVRVLNRGAWHTNTIAADTFGLPAFLDYYQVSISAGAQYADFEIEPLNGDVDLVLRQGAGLPDLAVFDFFSASPGIVGERIRVRQGGLPVGLAPGVWSLGVINQEVTSVTYRVRVTEGNPAVRDLFSGATVTGALPQGVGVDYYRFFVSPTATNVVFELGTIAGTARLRLHYGLPLPDASFSDYELTAQGQPPVPLEINAGSLPVPLAPGDWYVGIENAGPDDLTYTLTATEDAGSPAPLLTIRPRLRVTPGAVGFGWSAPPGLTFQVEYATAIPAVWTLLPGLITSADGLYSFEDDETQSGGRAHFKLYRLRFVR